MLLEMDSVLDNGSLLHGDSVLNEMSSLEMLREQASNRTFVDNNHDDPAFQFESPQD